MQPKVLIAIDTINIGGPGKGILQFLKCGGAKKTMPVIVLFDTGTIHKWQFKDELAKLHATIESLRQRVIYDPLLIPQGWKVIKKYGIQILQSHGYKGHVFCFILKMITGLPWVGFVHGWTAEDLKIKLYSKLDRFILRFANKVVIVSESFKKRINLNWVKEEKISTIHNAIDPVEFATVSGDGGIRSRYGLRDDERIIGVVGRFSPEKGQEIFIDAFRLVRDSVPNIKAMLVGEGQNKGILIEEVKKYGIEKDVIFTGYQEEMAQYYKAFDVVVMPSLSEGMPNVALEAMLFQKPVIATNVGGMAEVVIDGITGKVIEPKNSQLMAREIIQLVSNSDLMDRYGRAGRERVISEFNPNVRVQKIIDLYKEILQGYS